MKLLPFLSATVQFRFLPRPLLPGCWDWKAGFWLVLKEKPLPSDCFLRGPVKIWRKTSDPRKGPSCPHSSFAFAGVVSASRKTASFSLHPLSTADSASGALRCEGSAPWTDVLLLKQHHRGSPVSRAHNIQSLRELRSGGTHCARCLYSVFPSLFHCGHQERFSFPKTLPSFLPVVLRSIIAEPRTFPPRAFSAPRTDRLQDHPQRRCRQSKAFPEHCGGVRTGTQTWVFSA